VVPPSWPRLLRWAAAKARARRRHPPQGQGQNLGELGKQLNNPISSVWNITTQSNMYFYKGDLSSAYRGQFVFNFQPVLPIPLTKNWTLIPRPVIPIQANPYIMGLNPATGSAEWSRTGGFGDIALVTLLSPNIPGVILGFGPTFIFPTAPTHDLGQGKFQMGPSVVLGFISKNWVGGVFPQHWWSVAGTRATPVTSQTNIQYFLFRMLPGAWQVGFTPNILINWRADGGNQVTFPLGLGGCPFIRMISDSASISALCSSRCCQAWSRSRFLSDGKIKLALPNICYFVWHAS
jgi:hypothetical protein